MTEDQENATYAITVKEFKSTERWKEIKQAVTPYECLVCQTPAPHIFLHHLLVRPLIEETQPTDCVWLCKTCLDITKQLKRDRQVMCLDPYGIAAVKILLKMKVKLLR
jgi:hypothetical protein